MTDSLQPHGLYSTWNSPGQNTRIGSLSLLQGIFPTQGSNPGLSHWRQILYKLSHKESPRILEWVAYSFSSRSSQPRNKSGVSCIADREACLSGKPWNRLGKRTCFSIAKFLMSKYRSSTVDENVVAKLRWTRWSMFHLAFFRCYW